MDAADFGIVFFSHHALQLKGLPPLDKETMKGYFKNDALVAIDNKEELWEAVSKNIKADGKPVFLLLMSSGTFDGIDWNNVSSHN